MRKLTQCFILGSSGHERQPMPHTICQSLANVSSSYVDTWQCLTEIANSSTYTGRDVRTHTLTGLLLTRPLR